MIRTGDEYRDSIRDGREFCVTREKLADVATHP
jgi:4-hydroxyphenylacetate 3-monooxygenase